MGNPLIGAAVVLIALVLAVLAGAGMAHLWMRWTGGSDDQD